MGRLSRTVRGNIVLALQDSSLHTYKPWVVLINFYWMYLWQDLGACIYCAIMILWLAWSKEKIVFSLKRTSGRESIKKGGFSRSIMVGTSFYFDFITLIDLRRTVLCRIYWFLRPCRSSHIYNMFRSLDLRSGRWRLIGYIKSIPNYANYMYQV